MLAEVTDLKTLQRMNLDVLSSHKAIESQFKRKEYHSLAADLFKKKQNGNASSSALHQLEQSLLEKENTKPNGTEKRVDLLARNPNRLQNNRIDQAVFTRNNFGPSEAQEPTLKSKINRGSVGGPNQTSLFPAPL